LILCLCMSILQRHFIVTLLRYVSIELKELLTFLLTYLPQSFVYIVRDISFPVAEGTLLLATWGDSGTIGLFHLHPSSHSHHNGLEDRHADGTTAMIPLHRIEI